MFFIQYVSRFPNPENIFRGTLVFTCALELFYLKPQTTFPIYFPNWSQIRELSPNWRPSVSVFLVLHRLKGSRTHTSTSSWVPARGQIFDARKIVRSWLRTRLRSRRFRRRGLNAAAPLLLDKIHRQTFQTIVGRNGSSGELSRCVLVRQTLGKLTGAPELPCRADELMNARDCRKFERFAVISRRIAARSHESCVQLCLQPWNNAE